MASSEIAVDDIGLVKIFRRRGLKHIRISINRHGTVRLSIPWYVPKSAGISYLLSKKDWIKKHQKATFKGWRDGDVLTKNYFLKIISSDGSKTQQKVLDSELVITVPRSFTVLKRQESVSRHVRNFLKKQSENDLIPMLRKAAEENSFEVGEVKIKNLKSRWGSCDSHRNISLSTSLITLDNEMIYYVICHELVHTKHLNHGKKFWEDVERLVPDYKNIRKNLAKMNTLP